MTADLLAHTHQYTIPAALSLLPPRMDSPEARALLLAIGLQESGFTCRIQVPHGPAHGFWQFEKHGGVAGVLKHPHTAALIAPICDLFVYPATASACYGAIINHDVLAACFARLLLWIDPRTLPTAGEAAKGWRIYLTQWRPGTPHPEAWSAHFARAWSLFEGS